jgi:hypothetical protein
MIKNEKDIIDFVKSGAERILKDNPKADLVPIIFFKKGDKVVVAPVVGPYDRDTIRRAIDIVESKNPEWIATINEGYGRAYKKSEPEPSLIPGELEFQHKLGIESVKELVIIQARLDDRLPVIVTLDKINGKLLHQKKSEEYSGFLSLKKKKGDRDVNEVL